MSTTFDSFTASSQVFVPRGLTQSSTQNHQNFTSEMQKVDQQAYNANSGCFYGSNSNMHVQHAPMIPQHQHQPQLNYNCGAEFVPQQQQMMQPHVNYEQPKLMHNQSQGHYHCHQSFTNAMYTAPANTMTEFKMNFTKQNQFTPMPSTQQQSAIHQQRRGTLQHQMSLNAPQQDTHGNCIRKQFASNKNVFSSADCATGATLGIPSTLPLNKIASHCYADAPSNKSTQLSSNGDSCNFTSDEDDFDVDAMGFESPVSRKTMSVQTPQARMNQALSPAAKNNTNVVPAQAQCQAKMENGWKKKVKTELCRFWLNGQACENSQKEQGCGFAHGQEELQKKKGLSRQYLTSVCKNFLEHPSKCTYGQRCIFQHPTFDVRQRQKYVDMMQDNARYTAMRLFQDIEGSEVIYINTYAASTPRLNAFRNICSSAKDNGEDYVDPEEGTNDDSSTEHTTFSRDLFRTQE